MREIGLDVAVIGAGLIGSAVAWAAARQGRRVGLIDAQAPAAGTSGACDGYVAVSSKKPGLMMALATDGAARLAALADELPLGFEHHRSGGLLLCETAAVAEALEPQVEQVRGHGVAVEYLAGPALRALEPALAPDLHGAFHVPGEAIVSPYLLNFAYVEGARRHGARTFWRCPAQAFGLADGHLAWIDTPAGRIVPEQVVLAAGVWSAGLGERLGVDLPVRPRRGEIVVSERGARVATRYLMSGQYLTAKRDPEAAARSPDPLVRLGHGFVMEVNAEGQAIIGSTRQFAGFDRSNTAAGVRAIIAEAVRRVPVLAQARVLRCFAGLRPFVPDGRPIIGRSRRLRNLLVATGHEGDGVALSAVTGEIVARLLAGEPPGFDIEPLSPDRFAAAPVG